MVKHLPFHQPLLQENFMATPPCQSPSRPLTRTKMDGILSSLPLFLTKLSLFRGCPVCSRMFSAENSICPQSFIRDGPELLRTCSTCMSIPRPYLRGMLFICAEYIGSFVGFLRIHVHISRRRVSNHNLVWELHPSATPPLLLLFSIE